MSWAPMYWIPVASLLVLAVLSFFAWSNHQAKRQHAGFTKDDVRAAIENVLSGDSHDEWDLFLAWPIGDPYLESVRQRCIGISKEYSGAEKGKDIATGGETTLRLILDELRNRA